MTYLLQILQPSWGARLLAPFGRLNGVLLLGWWAELSRISHGIRAACSAPNVAHATSRHASFKGALMIESSNLSSRAIFKFDHCSDARFERAAPREFPPFFAQTGVLLTGYERGFPRQFSPIPDVCSGPFVAHATLPSADAFARVKFPAHGNLSGAFGRFCQFAVFVPLMLLRIPSLEQRLTLCALPISHAHITGNSFARSGMPLGIYRGRGCAQ